MRTFIIVLFWLFNYTLFSQTTNRTLLKSQNIKIIKRYSIVNQEKNLERLIYVNIDGQYYRQVCIFYNHDSLNNKTIDSTFVTLYQFDIQKRLIKEESRFNGHPQNIWIVGNAKPIPMFSFVNYTYPTDTKTISVNNNNGFVFTIIVIEDSVDLVKVRKEYINDTLRSILKLTKKDSYNTYYNRKTTLYQNSKKRTYKLNGIVIKDENNNIIKTHVESLLIGHKKSKIYFHEITFFYDKNNLLIKETDYWSKDKKTLTYINEYE